MTETVLDVLTSDHDALSELVDAAVARHTAGAVDDRDEGLLQQVVMDLVRHFVAEEQYFYPTVREHLTDGRTRSDAAFAAHRETEAQLKLLESSTATDAQIEAALTTVRRQLAEHIAVQRGLFAEFAQAVPDDELVRLADEVLGAEQLAPTRPRTVASENPQLNKFASLVEGFIDHVRDTYSNRGIDPDDLR